MDPAQVDGIIRTLIIIGSGMILALIIAAVLGVKYFNRKKKEEDR